MEFRNYTINEPFSYENYVLGDLKKQIMEQDNLGYTDIIKGYHEKNSFSIHYPSYRSKLTDKVMEVIKECYDTYADNFITKMSEDYKKFFKEFCDSNRELYLQSSYILLNNYPTIEDYQNLITNSIHTVQKWIKIVLLNYIKNILKNHTKK